jgi:exodeoxyribonuclease V beta subunit
VQPEAAEVTGQPVEAAPTPRESRERALARLAADDILRFPSGARAGETLHAMFERADFADASAWPEVIEHALRFKPAQASGDSASWATMAQRLLADVTSTQLPSGHRLAEIPSARRLVELEFSLPAAGLDARALTATLRRHGYPVDALAFGRLEGYLRGFIDLVYEHQGRFYVLDWKSNHLGFRVEDYAAAKVAEAMAQQGYHLQYLLYTVALHRYLRQRLRDYDYERHVGGVSYLFVRGVRPSWKNTDGSAAGVYFHRPTLQAIEELDALLGAREGALA